MTDTPPGDESTDASKIATDQIARALQAPEPPGPTERFHRMHCDASVSEKTPPEHFRSCERIVPRWWNGSRTWSEL